MTTRSKVITCQPAACKQQGTNLIRHCDSKYASKASYSKCSNQKYTAFPISQKFPEFHNKQPKIEPFYSKVNKYRMFTEIKNSQLEIANNTTDPNDLIRPNTKMKTETKMQTLAGSDNPPSKKLHKVQLETKPNLLPLA